MSNDESKSSPPQEQLPDLYRLLSLTPLETDSSKIQQALLEMQRKVDAAQKTDMKLAQRAAKVITLGKKNLLDTDRKQAYDRAWTRAFGGTTVTSAPAIETKAATLEWDLDELERCLPSEDPRGVFDLGRFLRYSATLPESNLAADYEKLKQLLGGAATAVAAPPEPPRSASLVPDYAPPVVSPEQTEPFAPLVASHSLSVPMHRIPPGGFARQIRRKRNRAMWLSVGGVFGAVALVSGAAVFWALNNTKTPSKPTEQLAQVSKPDKTKANAPKDFEAPPIPQTNQGSGLPKVAGLDGAAPGDMSGPTATSQTSLPEADFDPFATPSMPATSLPSVPMPAAPAPADSTPNTPVPAPAPSTPTPESTPTPPEPNMTPAPEPMPTPEAAADPELTEADKAKWNKAMKELLKTLGNQDFMSAKKLMTDIEALAQTQLQKDQFKRIAKVAVLAEEYHGFLLDAISGLGPAETFSIGSSEVAFVEGNEKVISLKIRGRLQTFKLTELQVGVANGLVDLKMDTAHPNSLARKAAFALVHPKTNDAVLKKAREQMAEAAGSGAVEADMVGIFDEDYSLKKSK